MGEMSYKAGASQYFKADATNILLIASKKFNFEGSFDDEIEEYNFENVAQAPIVAAYHESNFGPQIIFHFGTLSIIRNNQTGFPDDTYNACLGEYEYIPTASNPFTHDPTYQSWSGIDNFNSTMIYGRDYLSPEENAYNIGQVAIGMDYDQYTSVFFNNIPIFKPDENNLIDITREDLYMGCAYKNGRFYQERIYEDDPYQNANADDGGGNGTPDWDSDPITERALPPDFYGNSGLVTVYTPTTAELRALSNYLWSDLFDIDSFKKIVNNPFDLILALNYIPFESISAGTESVNVGNIVDTGLTMTIPAQENYRHDFGYLTLEEDERAFLDYSPYTRVSIHLPFIGTQALDIDLLRKNSIRNNTNFHLIYKYNIVNGSVTAYLYTADQKVLYEWAGNVSTPIPVAANDYTNTISSLAHMASSAVSGAVAGGMIGGPAGAAVGAVASAAGSSVDAVASLKPTVTHTGGIGSSNAVLTSTNDAFILVETPSLSVANNHGHYLGYPRNQSGKVNSCKGYNEIASIRLDSKTATEQEKEELLNILQSGYIYGDKSGVTSLPSLPETSGDGFTIGLYKNGSSNNRIDKSLTLVEDYSNCTLKENSSIINPTIKMDIGNNKAINANYCYIPILNRFYFINDKRCIRGNLWELDLSVDVLTSFRNDYLNNTAVFKKSEYKYNLYINDGSLQVDSRPNIKVKKFPNSLTNNGTYVMIMAGS